MQTKSVLPFLAVRFEQFKKVEEMKVALAIAQNMYIKLYNCGGPVPTPK